LARNVTLGQLKADVMDQADIAGSTARNSPTLLTRLINQSIQHFREKLSIEGAQHYLVSTSGTLSAGTTSPYAFYVLDLSAVSPSIVRCFGVDITVQNDVIPLTHVPFASRNDYGGTDAQGIPAAWAVLNTAKLAILPGSGSAYPYVVWYLPVLADLSADADTFNGVAGWEDFIVWDVVTKLIVRDQYPQAFQMALAKRDEMFADILRSATRVSAQGGLHVGRDVLAERLRGLGNSRRRLLPPP
jgi:hypothetical protein